MACKPLKESRDWDFVPYIFPPHSFQLCPPCLFLWKKKVVRKETSWCGGVQGGFQWITAWVSAFIEIVGTIITGIIYIALDIIAAILFIIGIIVTLYDVCIEVIKVLDIF